MDVLPITNFVVRIPNLRSISNQLKTILAVPVTTGFSHSQGHERPKGRVRVKSALPPIADVLVHRSGRRDVPKPNSCTATKGMAIRSPRRR